MYTAKLVHVLVNKDCNIMSQSKKGILISRANLHYFVVWHLFL